MTQKVMPGSSAMHWLCCLKKQFNQSYYSLFLLWLCACPPCSASLVLQPPLGLARTRGCRSAGRRHRGQSDITRKVRRHREQANGMSPAAGLRGGHRFTAAAKIHPRPRDLRGSASRHWSTPSMPTCRLRAPCLAAAANRKPRISEEKTRAAG
jgi:hypothetical protein